MENGAIMAQHPTLLIVSKDEASVEALRICLSDPGLTLSANSAEQGQKVLDAREVPVMLLELNSPGNFESLLASAMKLDSDSQVILCAAAGEQALAARLLKLGACDILSRPADPEAIRSVTDRAMEAYSLRRQLKRWQSGQGEPDQALLLGSSPVIHAFSERVAKLSAHDASVLITGEPGTGKTRVARLIHAQSRRSSARFVAFDCLRAPAPSHESRLFGQEGAPGLSLLESAEGGTLYLHEVDALSPQAQERLQTALKERELRRLNSGRYSRLDLRIISSTRINLRNAVHKNLFREDLYWSLCGVALEVPALRERMGDIEELLQHFLNEACLSLSKKPPQVPLALVNAVRAHSFPGNVSELKHLAGMLAALTEGNELTLAALPAQIMTPLNVPRSAPAGALALKPIVHEFEKQFLIRALKAVGFNQSKAARVLDIHRNTLILKMLELGIPNKRARVKKEAQAAKGKS